MRNTRSEKVKLIMLGALATLAWHQASTRVDPVPRSSAPCPNAMPLGARPMPAAGPRRGTIAREFRPVFPSRLDAASPPPLDFSGLARLQYVEGAGRRNVFEFVATPPRIRSPPAAPRSAGETTGVAAGPAQSSVEPSPPVFYGYTLRRGSPPVAFLLKDDEIHVAKEEDRPKDRYRLSAFSVESVTVEDRKAGGRQTLPLLLPQ